MDPQATGAYQPRSLVREINFTIRDGILGYDLMWDRDFWPKMDQKTGIFANLPGPKFGYPKTDKSKTGLYLRLWICPSICHFGALPNLSAVVEDYAVKTLMVKDRINGVSLVKKILLPSPSPPHVM